MLTQRKKRAMLLFAGLFAVLGICFAYFYLFSSGIELRGGVTSYSGNTAAVQVTVQNNGFHELRDLTIGEKVGLGWVPLEGIGSLKPGESRSIALEIDAMGKSQAVLAVRGSFQDEVTAIVPLIKQGLPLGITLGGPSTVFPGSEFELEIELCNPTGLDVSELTISAIPIDQAIISARTAQADGLQVQKNSCSKSTFGFRALKPGKTAIIFNIKSPNDSKTSQKEVSVAE